MTSSISPLRRATVAAAILASVLTLGGAGDASARMGGGGSFGNRGTRTFSVPSGTATAPRPSAMPGSRYGQNSFAPRPNAGGGFFSGGFGRGLLGGLVGAGLLGMLFGHGLGGGLGGGASILGLILQLGLLYLAFRFVMGFFRNRQPAFGGAASGPAAFQAAGGGFGGGQPRTEPISIVPEDYTRFEKRLGEAQALYSNEDTAGLRRVATPEMADHFAREISDNARQGVVNRITDVRLLQGDLSEAWREDGTEFATVAMRFALVDTMVDRASGQPRGDAGPREATELWTFTRPAGAGPDGWIVSAIQQA